MEKIKFSADGGDYSTSRGRWCKYFFNQSNQVGLMTIGETDDYFYFTLSLKEGVLKEKYSITLDKDSIMYYPLHQMLNGFSLIDVFEEGTPEKKSLCFEKNNDNIKITFNLTAEERVFYTIEFANLRRLGDTRFKNLVSENKNEMDIETESDFRYKFKVRLHKLLDELEDLYKSQQTQNMKDR